MRITGYESENGKVTAITVTDETRGFYDKRFEEERPHGEWIYNQYDGNPNIGNWHCSECRHIVYIGYGQKPDYNYCPNCGAKMGVNQNEL